MLLALCKKLAIWLLFLFYPFSLSFRLIQNYAFNRNNTTRMTTSVQNTSALCDHYSIKIDHQPLKAAASLNYGTRLHIGESWTSMSVKYRPLSPNYFGADFLSKRKTLEVDATVLDICPWHENTGLQCFSAGILQKNLHARVATRFRDKFKVSSTSPQ